MKRVFGKKGKWLNKKFLIFFLLASALILFPWLNNKLFWTQPTEIENALVNLGNPLTISGQTGRSLNAWDLQVFDGKIYVAGGSTVENTGPIDVWAYNPSQQKFEKEYTVQEEAIELFRVFDNQLYIPAADPKIGDSNKFYRRSRTETWQLYQSDAVQLAHMRDLIKLETGEILLVGNNRYFQDLSKPAIAITRDDGQTFEGAGIENPPSSEFNWFFSVFTYQGKVFAPTSLLRDSIEESKTIAVYNSSKQKFELDPKLGNSEFIPQSHFKSRRGQQGFDVIYCPWHPVEFKKALVYPVRSYSYYNRNYHQEYMNSLGFYVKSALSVTPFSVVFPDGKSVGEDVLVIDNQLYAISNARVARNKFVVYVYKTDDPTVAENWQEVLHFRSTNKVRSFEYLDNTFYFGLGQDYGDPIGKAGEILSFSLRTSSPTPN